MRRKDREMDKEFALQVVDKCEWATLGMSDENIPYCLPITIVRIKDAIYFHTAQEGQKIDVLQKNPNVCLSCVGQTQKIPQHFTTEYESAIIKGKASEVVQDEEKIYVLREFCLRHAKSNMANFDDAIKMSLNRTGIWKVEIEEITGKRKKYDSHGKEMKYGRME